MRTLKKFDLKNCPICKRIPEIVERDVEPQGDSWYGKTMEIFIECKCGLCFFDEYFHVGFGTEEYAAQKWNEIVK